jgi:capsular polysaccharide biosynthesis protein
MVLLALAAGYQVTSRSARYQAISTLYVGVAEYSGSGVFSNDILQGQADLASTFSLMIRTTDVAESAQAATGVDRSPQQILGETYAVAIPNTALIEVSVTDPDPVVAMRLSTAVAQAFTQEMLKLDPVTRTIAGNTTTPVSPVSVSQQAQLPSVPLSNGLSKNLTLSGLFGLLVGIGIVFLIDYLDVSVRSSRDVEDRVGLPVLGVIPLYPPLTNRELPLVESSPHRAEMIVDD